MSIEDREDRTQYAVVINHEEQYSIWPADRELPAGWNAVGKTGTKAECLAYVEEVWTDMRPASVRRHMEGLEAARRGNLGAVSYRTPWAVIPRPDPAAALRLFCFPHAGGAASAFAGWADGLPAGVELVAVQPPGRERRIAEAPIDRLEPFLDAAHEALRPLFDRPFAFFGHSTGALVGYELARRQRAEGAPGPVHLVASGRWPPHLQDPEPPVYALPAEELIAALRRYGGTAEEVLADRDLMDFLLPLLRADFALGDTYRHQPGPPLEVPITTIGGDRDPRVPLESLQAWREHTTGAFAAQLLPGDHFFLQAQRPAVLQILARALAPTLLVR